MKYIDNITVGLLVSKYWLKIYMIDINNSAVELLITKYCIQMQSNIVNLTSVIYKLDKQL